MGVPTDILLKPTALTPEEFEAAKKHTSIGHKILSGSSNPVLEMGAEIACTHHENWDGSGYPRGLKGKEIPLAGMIVHVCDVYDTLRSRRPYKEPVMHKKAVSVIVTKVRKRWAVVEGERKLAYFLDFANPSPTTFPVKGRQAGVRVVPEPSR
jgi:putative two-component system response regulator